MITERLDSQAFDSDRQVEYLWDEVTPEGVLWRYVDVPDRYTDSSYEATELRKRISGWEKGFRDGEYLAVAPSVKDTDLPHSRQLEPHNDVSRLVYTNPAMYHWRANLVPSALALVPLQDPTISQLPGEKPFPIDDMSRRFFTHSRDAIAIRSRAMIMQDIATEAIETGQVADRPIRMVSVASGTAWPVIGAVARIDADIDVNLTLVDNDISAHRMADGFIAEAQLPNLTYQSKSNNILKDLVASDRLVQEIGEARADFVDAMGIFEYMPTRRGTARDFLHKTYQLVRPGGTLVVGNMLDTHPELSFNKYGIGWPSIYPRSRQELFEIIEQADIELSNVTVYEPTDGVYAVIDIKKPLEAGD